MKGCFGDINKMDGHIAWIFNSRRCSSGFKRTSLLQFLLRNTLRNCHRQVFRLCRADLKIAWCVWVVMFVKQYTGLQEMLCDQYWNKFNIMQPVLVHVIETSFFSEITWLQRQWIDSLLKGLGASSYAVLSLSMTTVIFSKISINESTYKKSSKMIINISNYELIAMNLVYYYWYLDTKFSFVTL